MVCHYILAVLLVTVVIVVTSGVQSTTVIRVDCHPEPNASQQNCEDRGCIWQSDDVPGIPSCFFGNGSPMAGYTVRAGSSTGQPNSTVSMVLDRSNTPVLFANPAQTLQLVVTYVTDTNLRIHIYNPYSRKNKNGRTSMDEFRATLPRPDMPPPSVYNRKYTVTVQHNPFGIAVTRLSTGAVIFDTRNIAGMTFEEQYLSITARTVVNVYGFGEQTHPNLKHDMAWHKWAMFSRDQPVTGINKMNLYGVHPVFLGVESDGKAHQIAFFNAHAQYVELAAYPAVSYKTIGGALDFEIFLGETPDDAVQQYVQSIGVPAMPPYWSLGFHLCRYGYNGIQDLQATLQRNQKAGMPQDVQWIDIDYMDRWRDFTYDRHNWNGLPSFATTLQNKNMKFVPILDPCIASQASGYRALDEGIKQNAFIADPSHNKQFLEGKVWPGNSYFPDFTSRNGVAYWQQMIQEWNSSVRSDGFWIDMNEPANFVTGSTSGCAQNKYNNPPFVPLPYTNILEKTICMDAMQSWGRHYDVHSMFGYSEAIATRQALLNLQPGIRPFILSRSTYIGSGHYTAHWTGDNNSQWNQLLYSIITVLEFQLFGIPFVGADICGFNGNADEELCVRWMQLGTFYPFMRNHNAIDQNPQDPAVWNDPAKSYIRNTLKLRYKLLPHFYTVFHQSHTTGGPIVRPLFFQYANDPQSLAIDTQFLWSSTLMVVPILKQRATQRQAYFPKDRWFDFYSGLEVSGSSGGRTRTLSIPLSSIGLFIRGGSVVPWQQPAMNTVESRKNPFGLTIALNVNQCANGTLYLDDGVSLGADLNGASSILRFAVSHSNVRNSGIVSIWRTKTGYSGANNLQFSTLQVYGVTAAPVRLQVLGTTVTSGISYSAPNKAFTVTGLNIPVSSAIPVTQVVEWFY